MPELDTAGTEVDLMVLDRNDVPSAVMTITGLGESTSGVIVAQILDMVENANGMSVRDRGESGAGGVTHD